MLRISGGWVERIIGLNDELTTVRVLLADDNSNISEIVHVLLHAARIDQIRLAQNGQEALDLLDSWQPISRLSVSGWLLWTAWSSTVGFALGLRPSTPLCPSS